MQYLTAILSLLFFSRYDVADKNLTECGEYILTFKSNFSIIKKKRRYNIEDMAISGFCRVKSSIYYLVLPDVVLNIRCTSDPVG